MVGKSPSCILCNGLEKKDQNDVRLAIEINPSELVASACNPGRGCACCAVILAAVEQFGEAAWGNLVSPEGERSPPWGLVDDVAMIIAYGLSSDQDTLFLELYPKDDRRAKRALELFFPKSGKGSKAQSPQVEAVRHRPSLSGHPLSTAGLQWVHMKLQTCLKEHDACPREKETELPKRVLEFHRCSSGGKISVRLRANQATTRKFAALSHCWGMGRQTCTTTQETLQGHISGIPWSEIPQTFQDAIRFCLAIGVNYLWVDALCIVQDDPVDWQIESAKMANIYQNAYITLAATHASSGAGGCFPVSVSHPSPSVSEHSLLLPKGLERAALWRGLKFREKLNHWSVPLAKSSSKWYPLLTRGWVFQERVLSPRLLYFCADEMIWECNSTSVCECGSMPAYKSARELFNDIVESEVFPAKEMDGLAGYSDHLLEVTNPAEPTLLGGWRNRFFGMLSRKILELIDEDPPLPEATLPNEPPTYEDLFQVPRQNRFVFIGKDLPQETLKDQLPDYQGIAWRYRFQNDQSIASFQWQRLVEQYSGLLLSKETDRLPALSGIGARAQPHLGDYLAGLWSSTLLSDVLWRVSKLELGAASGGPPQGPSWSWASNNRAVSFWEDLRVDLTRPEFPYWKKRKPKVESASVELAGRNPFGEVTPGSGELVVRRFLKPAVVRYVWTRPWLSREMNTGSGSSSSSSSNSLKRELDPLKYDIDFGNGLELPLLADHVLIQKGDPSHHIQDGASVSMLLLHPDVCLVLIPYSGGVVRRLPTYRRIGIMRQPEAFAQIYTGAVDWMANSVEERIRII